LHSFINSNGDVCFEQLMSIIRQAGQQQVVNNPAIPNEYNDQVMNEAGSSIVGGLQQALSGGGLAQIMKLFGQEGSEKGISSLLSNPLVQNIISQFTGKLSGQFNLDQTHASQVSSNLILRCYRSLQAKCLTQMTAVWILME
jgi:hypothetical protein